MSEVDTGEAAQPIRSSSSSSSPLQLLAEERFALPSGIQGKRALAAHYENWLAGGQQSAASVLPEWQARNGFSEGTPQALFELLRPAIEHRLKRGSTTEDESVYSLVASKLRNHLLAQFTQLLAKTQGLIEQSTAKRDARHQRVLKESSEKLSGMVLQMMTLCDMNCLYSPMESALRIIRLCHTSDCPGAHCPINAYSSVTSGIVVHEMKRKAMALIAVWRDNCQKVDHLSLKLLPGPADNALFVQAFYEQIVDQSLKQDWLCSRPDRLFFKVIDVLLDSEVFYSDTPHSLGRRDHILLVDATSSCFPALMMLKHMIILVNRLLLTSRLPSDRHHLDRFLTALASIAKRTAELPPPIESEFVSISPLSPLIAPHLSSLQYFIEQCIAKLTSFTPNDKSIAGFAASRQAANLRVVIGLNHMHGGRPMMTSTGLAASPNNNPIHRLQSPGVCSVLKFISSVHHREQLTQPSGAKSAIPTSILSQAREFLVDKLPHLVINAPSEPVGTLYANDIRQLAVLTALIDFFTVLSSDQFVTTVCKYIVSTVFAYGTTGLVITTGDKDLSQNIFITLALAIIAPLLIREIPINSFVCYHAVKVLRHNLCDRHDSQSDALMKIKPNAVASARRAPIPDTFPSPRGNAWGSRASFSANTAFGPITWTKLVEAIQSGVTPELTNLLTRCQCQSWIPYLDCLHSCLSSDKSDDRCNPFQILRELLSALSMTADFATTLGHGNEAKGPLSKFRQLHSIVHSKALNCSATLAPDDEGFEQSLSTLVACKIVRFVTFGIFELAAAKVFGEGSSDLVDRLILDFALSEIRSHKFYTRGADTLPFRVLQIIERAHTSPRERLASYIPLISELILLWLVELLKTPANVEVPRDINFWQACIIERLARLSLANDGLLENKDDVAKLSELLQRRYYSWCENEPDCSEACREVLQYLIIGPSLLLSRSSPARADFHRGVVVLAKLLCKDMP